MRLNGWQRIGVVLTVVWAFGWTCFLAFEVVRTVHNRRVCRDSTISAAPQSGTVDQLFPASSPDSSSKSIIDKFLEQKPTASEAPPKAASEVAEELASEALAAKAAVEACDRNNNPFNPEDWAIWSALTFLPLIVLWPATVALLKVIRWIRAGFDGDRGIPPK